MILNQTPDGRSPLAAHFVTVRGELSGPVILMNVLRDPISILGIKRSIDSGFVLLVGLFIWTSIARSLDDSS